MKIKCIVCLKDTEFEEDTPLEMRETTYIDGCGQLCDQCMKKVAANKDVIDTELIRIRDEKATRYRLVPLDPYRTYTKMACPICFELCVALGMLLDDIIYHCETCSKFFRKEDAP